MQRTRWTLGVALVAAPFFISACHTEHSGARVRNAAIAERDSTRKLGPGDIRIVTTDSVVDLSLIGDSVFTGLAGKTLAQMRAATDTTGIGTGFAASIEKMVKSKMQAVANKELAFPLSSIGDVKYESGRLELFDLSGKRAASFGGGESGGKPSGGTFSERDARAFVAAVQARKAAHR